MLCFLFFFPLLSFLIIRGAALKVRPPILLYYWVVHLSSGNSGVKYKACSGLPCTGWVPWMLTWEQKEHCMQVYHDLLNKYEAEVTVSWIASLPVIRCGNTTVKWNQNGSLWTGDMWIHHWRKSLRWSPQQVMRCALSFWDKKGIILLDFLEPRQTINSDHYIMTLSWWLKLTEIGQRRQLFSCNITVPGPIQV